MPTTTTKHDGRSSASDKVHFDPRKYSVIYEEMIESKEARECFRKYLTNTSLSDETILFLDELDNYKKDYDKTLSEIMDTLKLNETTNNDDTTSIISSNESSSSIRISTIKKSQLKKVTKQLRIILDKCDSIFNIFLVKNSEKELNIGQQQQEVLIQYQNLQEKFMNFTKLTTNTDQQQQNLFGKNTSPSSPSSPTNSSTNSIMDRSLIILQEGVGGGVGGSSDLSSVCSTDTTHNWLPLCMEMIELLDYQKLFNEIGLTVHMDLKLDQFPRFVRSQFLFNFLKEKGETFTRSIAIDTSKGVNADLRFKPNDLRDKTVSDNHIYFGYTLAEDTPDWKLLQDKQFFQSYTSKTSYVFSSSRLKGMKLFKSVMYFPYSFDDVWAMWVHGDNHVKFDPQAHANYVFHRYVPPTREGQKENTVHSPMYALQLLTSAYDYKVPFLRKRYFCMTGTTIKDPFNDMIMYVMHTGDFSQQELPRGEHGVDALGLTYYIFYKVSDKMTRVVHILYGDANLKFSSTLLFELFWKKRTKSMYTKMIQVLEELTENGTKKIQLSDCVDDQYYQKSVIDNQTMYPNRSWFLEWSKSSKEKKK